MDYIHYEAEHNETADAENAMMAVEGITGLRGAATDDISALRKHEGNDRREISHCLNTVTCRIM